MAAPLALGCASTRETQERLFVAGSAEKLGDLYWRGELTDEQGNRWNVWILPGIAPSLEDGGEAWLDAADYADDLFEGQFWADRGENFTDGIEFAFVDSLGDFMIEGIADGYVITGRSLSRLADETPFGWIPRMAARAIWGFVLEPIGRIVGGTVGFAGGIAYSISMPVGQVVVRPVGATIYAGGAGIVIPVARIAVHQPAYLFAIVNREPAVQHNGSFGLKIIDRAEGSQHDRRSTPSKLVLSRADLDALTRGFVIDEISKLDIKRTNAQIEQDRRDLRQRIRTRKATRAKPAGGRFVRYPARLDPAAARYASDQLERDLRDQLEEAIKRFDGGVDVDVDASVSSTEASAKSADPTRMDVDDAIRRFRERYLDAGH